MIVELEGVIHANRTVFLGKVFAYEKIRFKLFGKIGGNGGEEIQLWKPISLKTRICGAQNLLRSQADIGVVWCLTRETFPAVNHSMISLHNLLFHEMIRNQFLG